MFKTDQKFQDSPVYSSLSGDLNFHNSHTGNKPSVKTENQSRPERVLGDQPPMSMGPLGFPCANCEVVCITGEELKNEYTV